MKTKNKQTGFSLLEVLVTLVILAIGLLGVAGLQAIGLKNNNRAQHLTFATQATYDIIDRMLANKAGRANYIGNSTAGNIQPTCTTTGCTVGQMANNDLYEWNQTLTSGLPGGAGIVAVNGSGVYTITITWNDGDADDHSFNTSFRP